MSFPVLAPAFAHLHTIDVVLQAVVAARGDVDDLAVRAARARDAVQWQAPSARAFAAQAEGLERMLRTVQSTLELTADDLRRARYRLAAAAVP
ncbi:hypothetical protein F6B41_12585 [Microbacterium lushaniae]|nr:hypothetical protein F6B41_13775 [Microbacterium lushaniae]KAA9154628.1 hypothetical protein F6B41_12585 [Microbacterium lushaniae]